MTDTPPDARADESLEGGLRLRRNATMGFAVGAALAAVVFGFFVLLPGVAGSTGLYVGLAFVLGVSVGVLVTLVLVVWRVRRLAKVL